MYIATVRKKQLITILGLVVTGIVIWWSVLYIHSHNMPIKKDVTIANYKDGEKYLQSLGWEVTLDTEKQARIPTAFDKVLNNYNHLQKRYGYDLEEYKGKTLTVYIYAINNYGQDFVYCSLYTYHGKLVAGDIASHKTDGFMKGIESKQDGVTKA